MKSMPARVCAWIQHTAQMPTNLMYVITYIVPDEYGKVREYFITLYIAIGSMLVTTSWSFQNFLPESVSDECELPY